MHSSPEPRSPIFQFEADFANSLRCIPMVVRFKLDTCGIKLKLDQWHKLSQHERQTFVDLPCSTEQEIMNYRWLLQRLVLDYTGQPAKELAVDPHPAWMNADVIPTQTLDKARDFNIDLQVDQWRNLSPVQRFALIKLSQPGHEHRNFLPALQEFGLAT